MFEKATKIGLRFKTSIGIIATEDVWQLSLDALNSLAKALNKELKEQEEESFIVTKNTDSLLELRFNIVKHIIQCKLKDKELAQEKEEKQQKKKRLMEILEQKQSQELESLSTEEILKQLEQL